MNCPRVTGRLTFFEASIDIVQRNLMSRHKYSERTNPLTHPDFSVCGHNEWNTINVIAGIKLNWYYFFYQNPVFGCCKGNLNVTKNKAVRSRSRSACIFFESFVRATGILCQYLLNRCLGCMISIIFVRIQGCQLSFRYRRLQLLECNVQKFDASNLVILFHPVRYF